MKPPPTSAAQTSNRRIKNMTTKKAGPKRKKRTAAPKKKALHIQFRTALNRAKKVVEKGLHRAIQVGGDTYNAVLTWRDNSELSEWLAKTFSHQAATLGSKAMDAEYIRTKVAGGWHRIYDGGHTLHGSWEAISRAFPNVGVFEIAVTWAHEYWKDLVTARGMPIIGLEPDVRISEYLKHLDCVNLAESIGGGGYGVGVYRNWHDSKKLIEAAGSADASGIAHANVLTLLVSLVALGRAWILLKGAEEIDTRELITAAVKGSSRAGAVMLVTLLPGGFLIHFSSGMIINVAHQRVWEIAKNNRVEFVGWLSKTFDDAAASFDAFRLITGHRSQRSTPVIVTRKTPRIKKNRTAKIMKAVAGKNEVSEHKTRVRARRRVVK